MHVETPEEYTLSVFRPDRKSLLRWMRAACGAAAALCLILSQSPASAQESPLRWKFRPKQKLQMQYRQITNSRSRIQESDVAMEVETAMEIDWIVQSVDESGVADIEQRYRSLKISFKSPGVDPIAFDSTKPNPKPKSQTGDAEPNSASENIAAAVRPLIGLPVRLKISPRGEVTDVTIPAASQATLEKLAAKLHSELFSVKRMQEMMRQTNVVLPENSVAVGDKWSRQWQMDTELGKLNAANDYAFRGDVSVKGVPLQKIEVKTKLSLPEKSTLKIKQQSYTGSILFDTRRGRLSEVELKQRLVTQSPVRELVLESETNSTTTLVVIEP